MRYDSAPIIRCGVFFLGSNDAGYNAKNAILSGVLFGGYLKASAVPVIKPEENLPVLAEPTDESKEKVNEYENPTVETFMKLYEYDLSLVPDGLYPIIPYDLSREADGELRLFNDTNLIIDLNELRDAKATVNPISYGSEPTVLIIHTHGTEAYSEDGILGYSDTYNIPRSYDVTKNVVSIGKLMVKILEENGVNAIHCDVMHDAESYLGAYDRSAETINKYLKKYPSIKYVFDVHRDSIATDNGKAKPVSVVDGLTTAQAMLVVGTDTAGAPHPNWIDNLTVASVFQKALVARYKTLMRPLSLRASSFNAEHTTGSVLIEIGTCCNTISEAKNCAALLGQTISKIILSDGIPTLS